MIKPEPVLDNYEMMHHDCFRSHSRQGICCVGPRLHRKFQDDSFLLLPARLPAKVYADPFKDADRSHQAHCWEDLDMLKFNDSI